MSETHGYFVDPNEPTKPIYGKLSWAADKGLTAITEQQAAALSAALRAPTAEHVIAERARRLALGFDYDFEDVRGVHHIGTTPEDMIGWDEVATGSQALIALGFGSTEIAIVTDTGPAVITAIEFQEILAAATAHRQPIWAASFVLQAMDPIPANYADNSYWT